MRVPHILFFVINPAVSALLRSPLHRIVSSSVLRLSFEARRSKRAIALPLRYARIDGEIHCFTTDDSRWWRNLKDLRSVEALIAGETITCVATASRVCEGNSLNLLRAFLTAYPSDASYHDVSVTNSIPSEADLARTPARSIHVRIRELASANT